MELEDSDSLPTPLSLPSPLSAGGMFDGSAGRATGRIDGPPGAIGGFGSRTGLGAATGRGAAGGLGGAAGLGAAGLGAGRVAAFVGVAAGAWLERFTADRFPSTFAARVVVDDRRAVVRLEPEDFAFGRLAVERFARVLPARLAVIRLPDEVDFFAVGRFAADFFTEDFFTEDFFAEDFFTEDFFLAGISPPLDDAMSTRFTGSARIA
ncbi:MAG: hypothetical protein M3Z11_06465 [Candidatus Dormibacteraeota bacterium]|nr:hypothetical protein [Candidatus Dormibacteraeota bacterium]